MNAHDEANLAQLALLREHVALGPERAVFELNTGERLTLNLDSWRWDPASHVLVAQLEPLIQDRGYLPLEVRVREAARALGARVLEFVHTPPDHGEGVVY